MTMSQRTMSQRTRRQYLKRLNQVHSLVEIYKNSERNYLSPDEMVPLSI